MEQGDKTPKKQYTKPVLKKQAKVAVKRGRSFGTLVEVAVKCIDCLF
jgi:hypothetical protein